MYFRKQQSSYSFSDLFLILPLSLTRKSPLGAALSSQRLLHFFLFAPLISFLRREWASLGSEPSREKGICSNMISETINPLETKSIALKVTKLYPYEIVTLIHTYTYNPSIKLEMHFPLMAFHLEL